MVSKLSKWVLVAMVLLLPALLAIGAHKELLTVFIPTKSTTAVTAHKAGSLFNPIAVGLLTSIVLLMVGLAYYIREEMGSIKGRFLAAITANSLLMGFVILIYNVTVHSYLAKVSPVLRIISPFILGGIVSYITLKVTL